MPGAGTERLRLAKNLKQELRLAETSSSSGEGSEDIIEIAAISVGTTARAILSKDEYKAGKLCRNVVAL